MSNCSRARESSSASDALKIRQFRPDTYFMSQTTKFASIMSLISPIEGGRGLKEERGEGI